MTKPFNMLDCYVEVSSSRDKKLTVERYRTETETAPTTHEKPKILQIDADRIRHSRIRIQWFFLMLFTQLWM